MINDKLTGPPSYNAVLAYAKQAVQSEMRSPASPFSGYERQYVLDDVLNHFNGTWVSGMGGAPLALSAERDADLITQAVREAEKDLGLE